MVEVRALVPLVDKEGKEIALDEVVDVDADQAAEWRAAGKVSLITAEKALEEAARSSGHYSDVTGREEVGQVQHATSHPGPQTEEEEDEPQGRKARKR